MLKGQTQEKTRTLLSPDTRRWGGLMHCMGAHALDGAKWVILTNGVEELESLGLALRLRVCRDLFVTWPQLGPFFCTSVSPIDGH